MMVLSVCDNTVVYTVGWFFQSVLVVYTMVLSVFVGGLCDGFISL